MGMYTKKVEIRKNKKLISHNCKTCREVTVCCTLNRLRKLDIDVFMNMNFKCERFNPSTEFIQRCIDTSE